MTDHIFTDSIYGVSLSSGSRIVASSFIRNSNENYIELEGRKFFHRLPASKVAWIGEDRFASVSTSLRIWNTKEDRPVMKLSPRTSGVPLTSFDRSLSNKIATCSTDTTIAVWDLERGKMETRMIAHDKAVFDVAFSPSKEFLFASVSDDGSMRLFDTRDLNHSTIVFEGSNPLLRLAWNEDNTIAAIAAEMEEVLFFDMRKVSTTHRTFPLGACPNAIAWDRNRCLAALSNGTVVNAETNQVTHTGSGGALNISCSNGKAAVVIDPKTVTLINLVYFHLVLPLYNKIEYYKSHKRRKSGFRYSFQRQCMWQAMASSGELSNSILHKTQFIMGSNRSSTNSQLRMYVIFESYHITERNLRIESLCMQQKTTYDFTVTKSKIWR